MNKPIYLGTLNFSYRHVGDNLFSNYSSRVQIKAYMREQSLLSLDETCIHVVGRLPNWLYDYIPQQSGRSPKVVALFSATNFSSNII